jgi:hypothetical protein
VSIPSEPRIENNAQKLSSFFDLDFLAIYDQFGLDFIDAMRE